MSSYTRLPPYFNEIKSWWREKAMAGPQMVHAPGPATRNPSQVHVQATKATMAHVHSCATHTSNFELSETAPRNPLV